MQSALKLPFFFNRKVISMEEKDSEISRPCEEFRIYFCGEISSGSVAWYFIDVPEKTESSTKKLNPFSLSKHFPSVYYAFLKGCIYSIGGQRRCEFGGETLLDDVWILDIKSLDSFAAIGEEKPKEPGWKRGFIPYWMLQLQEAIPYWKPQEAEKPKAPQEPGWNPCSIPLKRSLDKEDWGDWKPGCIIPPPLTKERKDWKPDSGSGETWKLDYVVPWLRGPPMTFARCNPHTMVVDQKLYVLSSFGGFEPNQNQADGWIEVFDPVVRKWESLPSPPDQIHSSVMISGLLKAKKEIIIAKQRWDRHPMLFYSYNIMTRCWNTIVPHESEARVHLPPNAGRAVTVGNTLYWISTEEHNHECIIRAYDLDSNMWFEDHLNTATIFGRHERFCSIYSSGPGFLHLHDQKFCLLLQSSITKNNPQSSIEYLYCVILDISPIYEHEDRGKFELTTVSVQKYSMDHYIDFLDCMLGTRGELESNMLITKDPLQV